MGTPDLATLVWVFLPFFTAFFFALLCAFLSGFFAFSATCFVRPRNVPPCERIMGNLV